MVSVPLSAALAVCLQDCLFSKTHQRILLNIVFLRDVGIGTSVSKTFIGPSKTSVQFLVSFNVSLKKKLFASCYAAVSLVYLSSHGYYSVCQLVFASCCVI